MTPEQKERIQKAARELNAALTEAGDYFTLAVEAHEVTQMSDATRKYVYSVTVEAVTQEIIR